MDTKKALGIIALALTCAAASAATPAPKTHRFAPHPISRKSVGPSNKTMPAAVRRVTGTTTPIPVETIGGLPWYRVTDGFALAKKQNKKILVDVYTDWCTWCKVMDRQTFPNPAITAILSKSFVLVKANAEDEKDGTKLAMQYGVNSFPMVMFFEPTGKLKAYASGFAPPEAFAMMLHSYLGDAKAPVAAGEKKTETVGVDPSAPSGTSVSMPESQTAEPKPNDTPAP